MGNQNGKAASKMAISAMSNVTHIEKRELQALRLRFKELSKANDEITRKEFSDALIYIGINPNDADILDKLFTMFDKVGNDQVNWKDYLVGVSPLITGDFQEKISVALSLYDVNDELLLSGSDILTVLRQMNMVSSYFGDAVLSEEQLVRIVDESLNSTDRTSVLQQSFPYKDYIDIISKHENVQIFLAGEGTMFYGGK
jgi:Ca2+-binding EF-hand superfamily protein